MSNQTRRKQTMTRETMTTWCNPNELLKSQYGTTTYRVWCEREVQRMAANHHEVVILEEDGNIALARA